MYQSKRSDFLEWLNKNSPASIDSYYSRIDRVLLNLNIDAKIVVSCDSAGVLTISVDYKGSSFDPLHCSEYSGSSELSGRFGRRFEKDLIERGIDYGYHYDYSDSSNSLVFSLYVGLVVQDKLEISIRRYSYDICGDLGYAVKNWLGAVMSVEVAESISNISLFISEILCNHALYDDTFSAFYKFSETYTVSPEDRVSTCYNLLLSGVRFFHLADSYVNLSDFEQIIPDELRYLVELDISNVVIRRVA